MELTVKIEGLKELEDNLMEMADEYGPKSGLQALRPAIKAAMKPAEMAVRSNTPVDSGALLGSTKTKIGKPSRKMLSSEHYGQNTVLVGRTGYFWTKPSLWNQALAVEFGTRMKRAKSPLRNSFDQTHSQMIKEFSTTLGPAIEKKAAQLHKKMNKR